MYVCMCVMCMSSPFRGLLTTKKFSKKYLLKQVS